MPSKNTIIVGLSKESDGSANVDLVSEVWHSPSVVCVQMVSFEDENNTCIQVRVGLLRGKDYYWIDSVTSTAAGVVYNVDKPVWFSADYRFVVRFTGSTTGDNLKAWIFGYYVE